MHKPRTHYDNLKVPRTASAEEIRAAFKRLALQYHPDRNPKKREEANRIMQIINASYAALNDPQKRASHDQWIARTEMESSAAANTAAVAAAARAAAARARAAGPRPTPPVAPQWSSARPAPAPEREREQNWGSVFVRVALVVIFLIVRLSMTGGSHRSSTSPIPYTPSNLSSEHLRAELAPNGLPWPAQAGELVGYPKGRNYGHSTVTVDNSANASPIFLKMFALEYTPRQAVRYIFIPAFSAFSCETLAPGAYELRYQDLESGEVRKSERFTLAESSDGAADGTHLAFSLFDAHSGRMAWKIVPESAF